MVLNLGLKPHTPSTKCPRNWQLQELENAEYICTSVFCLFTSRNWHKNNKLLMHKLIITIIGVVEIWGQTREAAPVWLFCEEALPLSIFPTGKLNLCTSLSGCLFLFQPFSSCIRIPPAGILPGPRQFCSWIQLLTFRRPLLLTAEILCD